MLGETIPWEVVLVVAGLLLVWVAIKTFSQDRTISLILKDLDDLESRVERLAQQSEIKANDAWTRVAHLQTKVTRLEERLADGGTPVHELRSEVRGLEAEVRTLRTLLDWIRKS